MSNWFVVAMGLATVFVGLICIIFVCMIMSAVVRAFAKNNEAAPKNASAPVATDSIADREKVVVAISAAIAEEIGEEAGAIRIVSLKKV